MKLRQVQISRVQEHEAQPGSDVTGSRTGSVIIDLRTYSYSDLSKQYFSLNKILKVKEHILIQIS